MKWQLGQMLTVIFWAASLLLSVTPAMAQPQVEIHAEPVRSWPVPASFSALDATMDTGVDGVVVMTEGDDICRVVVADSLQARSYEYVHQFRPSRCIDAVAHPHGGFFVRGERLTSEDEGIPPGFTAHIGADGELLWAVDDAELLESVASGQFVGTYDGARPGMAYDETRDRLMALSAGVQNLPDSQRVVTQAHVIRGQSGNLDVVGQTFGALGRDQVLDTVARDGEFLVITADTTGEEHRFYSYEVDRSMTQFEPESADWTSRQVVTPVAHRDELGTYYLWSAPNDVPPRLGIMRIEGLDDLVWTEELLGHDLVDPEVASLLEPQRVWVGRSLLAIQVAVGAQPPMVQFMDAEEGLPLALLSWEDMTSLQPLGMALDDDGHLRLMAFDDEDNRIREYALSISVSGEDGEDQDGGDTGQDDLEGELEGSGCSSAGSGTGLPVILLATLGVLALRIRSGLFA